MGVFVVEYSDEFGLSIVREESEEECCYQLVHRDYGVLKTSTELQEIRDERIQYHELLKS